MRADKMIKTFKCSTFLQCPKMKIINGLNLFTYVNNKKINMKEKFGFDFEKYYKKLFRKLKINMAFGILDMFHRSNICCSDMLCVSFYKPITFHIIMSLTLFSQF